MVELVPAAYHSASSLAFSSYAARVHCHQMRPGLATLTRVSARRFRNQYPPLDLP
jgi:hypothetical protein